MTTLWPRGGREGAVLEFAKVVWGGEFVGREDESHLGAILSRQRYVLQP
jgi:hypothetical protein